MKPTTNTHAYFSSKLYKLPLEVIHMTSKELMYVEDALSHEKYFQTRCQEVASQMQDAKLRNLVQQMAQKHQQVFQSFYGLL